MKVKALKSFCGVISMRKGQEKSIEAEDVALDLIHAGYVKAIEDTSGAENTQDVEDTSGAENTQDVEDTSGAENTQDVEDTSGAKASEVPDGGNQKKKSKKAKK